METITDQPLELVRRQGLMRRNAMCFVGRCLLAAICWLCGGLGGNPALASELPLLLAQRYSASVPVDAYLVSEKLDGVRAYWDGQTLRFRSGKPIPAPPWFLAALPPQALDGELWLGRGRFDELSGIVRRTPPDADAWRAVRYMIFELPTAPGDFSARVAAIRALVEEHDLPWLQAVAQMRVADARVLQEMLARVVRSGGEGLMLHRAAAPYTVGRSADLLKLTPWQDAEARVIAHLPGKGKYTGQLGALRVEMPDGRRFSLGSGLTDAQRRTPPPVGAQVTYRYRELTPNGLPRFPRFLRVREDF
jgi:DNA ligase-1